MAEKRKRYRSKGGWVMGSFWEAGRIGELYPIQAAPFIPDILEDIAAMQKPAAPAKAQSAQPTSLASIPARRIMEPPASSKPVRRVSESSPIGMVMPVAASNLSGQTGKTEAGRPDSKRPFTKK